MKCMSATVWHVLPSKQANRAFGIAMAQDGMVHSVVLLRPDRQLNLALRAHDHPTHEGRNPGKKYSF
jgi:hypothetical protein